ncbi:hypothetical protein KMW28_06485 [Flammeovirga yaeyamensis]|uniref:Lipoprotein n=1 Tax=Flammeovirga yaeyamensis TaxID=367791 RepID=A0AAX1N6P4_9BACT|nr:hypothetical protein [Flammeovirga yaeyamensis]MBB3697820.1 hypothetical protein [Flammeovirga yaeyamensis]NMF35824.1 hypothetical protein [Flammeovirga yaeyamensis]QWG03224.1 hypothetical protein KMW28_06485 [Flammeovirga yaeyamensis]
MKIIYRLWNYKLFIVLITAFLSLNSCGPTLDEIVVPPIDNYKIGVPILDGDITFTDLIPDEETEDIRVADDSSMYFQFDTSIVVATTEDLVGAFGSGGTDDFFSVSFPNPVSGVPVPVPTDGLTLKFTSDAGSCTSTPLPCVELQNDVSQVTYIRFMQGSIDVDYSVNAGEQFVLELRNIIASDGSTTVRTTGTSSESSASIDLTDVEFVLTSTPTLYMGVLTSGGQASANGTVSSIAMSSDNSADRLRLIFPSGLGSAGFDIPQESIETDYLGDIFPEGADVTFQDPVINFDFDNPLGTSVSMDLSQNGGVNAVSGNSFSPQLQPLSFAGSIADTGTVSQCTQQIDVAAASDFDTPARTNKFMCNAASVMSNRPTEMRFAGRASYNIQAGDEVFFSNTDSVKAYFTTRIPLHIGFTGMDYTSGSDLSLDFSSELDQVNTAILRSKVDNGLPVDGTLKFYIRNRERGLVQDSIVVDGNQDGTQVIKSAAVDDNGVVTGNTEQYLETHLTTDQVRSLLNAGYLDISFSLVGDADSTTAYPDPVLIKKNQRMNIQMGLLLDATVDLTGSN